MPHFSWVATESAKVLIMADEDLTVLSNSHITFDALSSDHQCILESLQGILWSFLTTASMCDNDLILAGSREGLFKLRSTLVDKRGKSQP